MLYVYFVYIVYILDKKKDIGKIVLEPNIDFFF